jgi:hypothetical protein
MKKLVKMTTSELMSIEADVDFDFTSNVKMDCVKIGGGGGGRMFI